MQPIKTLTHTRIQQGMQKGSQSARKIREELGLDENATRQEIFQYISNDLATMNFEIIYKESLNNIHLNQSVPAFTLLRTKNREAGGVIMINPHYPVSDQLEALYHEYAHIKDYSLPIYSTDLNEFNSKAIYDKSYQELIEFYADMIAYTLMMPPDQLMFDLANNAYNIDIVLALYSDYEKSSVLQWITIYDTFPCHFAWIMLQKETPTATRPILHDNCYYDHQLDPKPFIGDVLNTDDSAASIAIREGRNLQDGKLNKATVIDGISYQCFAYYGCDLSKVLLMKGQPIPVKYDRVLVIGWAENMYTIAKKMGNR